MIRATWRTHVPLRPGCRTSTSDSPRMLQRSRSIDRGSFVGVAALMLAATPVATRAQAARPTGTVIVSNMNDHTATMIDAASGRVIATLATGEGPHEVTASHDGKWALVSNYGVRGKAGHTITVIDVARATVAKTIELGEAGRPHGMAFLPGDTIV